MTCRPGGWWDHARIGIGPPPIETPEGWLLMYHGVRQTMSGALYRVGVALLDLADPVRSPRSRRPLAARARRRRTSARATCPTWCSLWRRRGRRHASPVLRRRRHLHRLGDCEGLRLARPAAQLRAIHAPGSPIGGRRAHRARGTHAFGPSGSGSGGGGTGGGTSPGREAARVGAGPAPAEPEWAPAPRAEVGRRGCPGPGTLTRAPQGRTSACVESTTWVGKNAASSERPPITSKHPAERALGVEICEHGVRCGEHHDAAHADERADEAAEDPAPRRERGEDQEHAGRHFGDADRRRLRDPQRPRRSARRSAGRSRPSPS